MKETVQDGLSLQAAEVYYLHNSDLNLYNPDVQYIAFVIKLSYIR